MEEKKPESLDYIEFKGNALYFNGKEVPEFLATAYWQVLKTHGDRAAFDMLKGKPVPQPQPPKQSQKSKQSPKQKRQPKQPGKKYLYVDGVKISASLVQEYRAALERRNDRAGIASLDARTSVVKRANNELSVEERLASTMPGAKRQVQTEMGVIDILTEEEIIEVKVVHKWKAALGQLLVYGSAYPNHRLRMHLFGGGYTGVTRSAIRKECLKHNIQVTFEHSSP